MPAMQRRFLVGLSSSLARCTLVGGLLLCLSAVSFAQVDEENENIPVGEGRLYNLTTKPFVFQLHRADGAAWTENYTVPAGKFYAVKTPKPGETTEIQGITGNGRGYVIIRHRDPVLGGYLTVRLPATNPANGKVQPTWFAVQDSNGITRLVQEASIDQAKKVQDNLKSRKPLTAQELENSKHMLRANWVLTD